jgi:hypothetical protein
VQLRVPHRRLRTLHAYASENQASRVDVRRSVSDRCACADPVVAGEHDVFGAGGAVPVGVPGRDDADVVGDEGEERGLVVGVGPVREPHHLGDAKGQEEGVGARRVRRPATMAAASLRRRRRHELQLLDEAALDGVDVLARAGVQDRRLAFLVHVHLEPLLHFSIAPADRNQREI